MVQCPFIFHMCTIDPSLFRVFYSKSKIRIILLTAIYRQERRSLNSRFPVAKLLIAYISLSLSSHPRLWRALQSYSETDVFIIYPGLSVLQFVSLFWY